MGNAMEKRGHVILDKTGLSHWLTSKQSSEWGRGGAVGSGVPRECAGQRPQ